MRLLDEKGLKTFWNTIKDNFIRNESWETFHLYVNHSEALFSELNSKVTNLEETINNLTDGDEVRY